uniref:RNA helicase n=1 Tax=Elaeophora elaphi TaxID=1147741 RepID=A0A158Q6T0_9BILA
MSQTFGQRSDFDFDDGFEQEERESDDSFEENIRKQLLEFRSGTEREIILEPLSIEKRKIVHCIATNCSLKSHSIGSGCNRRVVVTRFPHVDLCTYTNARDSEPVVLSIFQKRALSRFLTIFPLGYGDIDLYLRSGNASRQISSRSHASFNRPMLVPPSPSVRHAMENFRRSLPTYAMKEEILKTIRNHKVTMIIGGTGCGKTTQVPQFILEDAAERQQGVRIFCTQPRRLPVLAVSARVAKERNEKLGSTVGYHIRLEQKTSEQTVLTYCTSGVLLRLLTNDTNASNISHIILDEIHEREQKTDYLLIALRQALKNRDDLRIILMSATMEESRELFRRYFGPGNVFCLDIPSTLHKVEMFYLPEILALTDYKHSSSFTGGTFFGKTARSLNDDQAYNSFPQVDEFRSENYDDSKMQQGRNNKKKNSDEMNSNYEIMPSRRIASSAATNDHLSPVVISQVNNRQFPQISSNSHQEKGCYANRSGQISLTEMYSKMNIRNSEQNGCYQEPTFCDGYQMYPTQSGLAGFNYSQPPPNCVYAQQIPVTPYGMMTSYIGGPQMMYTTYHVVPAQNDCQNYYVMPPSVQDYTHPPKFYISANNADGFGTQWNLNGSNFSNQGSLTPFSLSNTHSGCRDAPYRDQEYYVSCLRDRPPHFDPSYVEILRRTNLDTMYLSYMISGGEQWLESVDTDLTVAVINYCMDSPIHGSILVFLPGYEDILAVREKAIKMHGCSTKPAIFTLHSQMGSQDQQRVFEPVGRGYRKVILSTNIAEASLTIDDVVFVIDCGKVKEKIYDHSTRISQLKMTWIAKSNAEQRAGRAGRCRSGYCFRLFTTEDYARMNPTQLPEMKRSAIHEVCLHAKMFAPRKYSVRQFLLNAPEPPAAVAIDRSFEFLEQIGAVFKSRLESSQMSHLTDNSYLANTRNSEPDLTDLGRHIVQLPLCPQLARFLLFGICLKCLSPVLTLVATLSHRDPFVLPPSGEREERNSAMMSRDIFAGFDYSDHMTFLRIYNAFIKLPTHGQSNFCMANYLSLSAMRMIVGIRQQLFIELQRLRLLPSNCRSADDPDLNRYSNSWPMIQAAIVAGSYPNIGFTRSGGQIRKIRTSNEVASLPYGCAVKRQASSAGMNGTGVGKLGKPEPVIEYLAFQELSKTGDNLSLRTVTAVPPLTVLLFAGPIHLKREVLNDYSIGDEFALNDDADTDSNTDECVFALEPWLDMQLMLKLRVKLMTYFIFVMKQPDRPETEETKELLATINQILVEDHFRVGFAECTDLPRFRERSPNSTNIETTNERSVHRRQLSGNTEEQCQRETVVGSSYFITRNHRSKQANGISNSDNRADFCGGPGIQPLEIGESIDSSGHLSYRPETENVTASTHSNEPSDDTFNPISPPPEEEQVPEDPCMSTLEEAGITKDRQALVMNVEEERSNTSGGDDLSRERSTEESNQQQETPNDTIRIVQRPGHGHFVPNHFRSDDQRIRRMFRQFVNRSRPQSTRSADVSKVEEQQEQHNNEEVRERRRENRRRDWHWRKNPPACCVAPSDAYRMPLAYFRGGGRGRSDRYRGGGLRGRNKATRKDDCFVGSRITQV